MTKHLVTSDSFFGPSNSANGDTFVFTADNSHVAILGLSDTKVRFLGDNNVATIANPGPAHIVDRGHGTSLFFNEGDGPITITGFQHDHTGHISEMLGFTKLGALTPSPDGHGGTYLTGIALKIHLVGDPFIPAAQHS